MRAVQELEKVGYVFWLDNGQIRFEYRGENKPVPSMVNPLLATLRERKQEAIAYLQGQNDNVIDFQEEAARVKAQLRRRGIAKIRSNTLGEDVYFAADGVAAENVKRNNAAAVVYTLEELKALSKNGGLTRQELKQIHESKRIFNGKIVENTKNPFAWSLSTYQMVGH